MVTVLAAANTTLVVIGKKIPTLPVVYFNERKKKGRMDPQIFSSCNDNAPSHPSITQLQIPDDSIMCFPSNQHNQHLLTNGSRGDREL